MRGKIATISFTQRENGFAKLDLFRQVVACVAVLCAIFKRAKYQEELACLLVACSVC